MHGMRGRGAVRSSAVVRGRVWGLSVRGAHVRALMRLHHDGMRRVPGLQRRCPARPPLLVVAAPLACRGLQFPARSACVVIMTARADGVLLLVIGLVTAGSSFFYNSWASLPTFVAELVAKTVYYLVEHCFCVVPTEWVVANKAAPPTES